MEFSPKNPNTRRTVLALLLLLLVLSPISVVTCFEETGHTVPEFAFHDHCDGSHENDSGEHNDISISILTTSHDHCSDVPVTIDALIDKASDESVSVQFFKLVAFFQPDVDISKYKLASDFVDDTFIFSSHYPPLDAVILLL